MDFHHHMKMRLKLKVSTALVLAVLLAGSGCSRKNDSPGVAGQLLAKDTVALGFYNVENLFDLCYDGSEYPEYRPGALGWNKQTWEKKVANIASVIIAMNVDVIGLCEVENRNALEGLRKELEKRGAGYPYAAIAALYNRSATCTALLSRFPVTRWQGFGAGNSESAMRTILEADVDCGGTTLKLFVNHWPAKTHPESQRLAMAQALVKRIEQLPERTDYAIIGDLNSDYDEWRKFNTEGLDDTRGMTGLNNVLKTVHGGPGKFSSYVIKREMAGADSALHYDLWFELPEDKRMSRTFHGLHETPDHILLPPAMFDSTGISYLDKSFEVFTWNGALLRNNEPFGWQMKGFGKRRFHAGEGYSDHLPIGAKVTKKRFTAAGDPAADAPSSQRAPSTAADQGGFEKSMEGWLTCGSTLTAARDSIMSASGRYCLRIKGDAPEKNCCAARTVLGREILNRPRWEKITFDLRGSGKISLRIRSGKGRWRYYNGPDFTLSGSARYQPVRFTSWKHIVLSFIYDKLASPDLAIELRAGKGMPFCFYLDNVEVE